MKTLPFKIPLPSETSIVVEEEIQPHFYTYLHQHQEVQITWILKGEGTLLAGNFTGNFGSGDIFWFGPNQPHVFRCDPIYFQKKNWLKAQSISVYFNINEAQSALMGLPELELLKKFSQRSSRGFRIEPDDYVAITEAFLKIRVKHGIARLTAFLELIDQVLSNSKHIPLSRKTYVTFLNEVRVDHACRRLKNADDKLVSEIAYSCGFGNVSHFNRVFRKVTGKTPREYQTQALARFKKSDLQERL